MPTYFTLKELLKSNTAEAQGIDNTPTWEVVDNLRELVDTFLDPLRIAWGGPIRVTSGYRCERLNEAVGGAKTSVHMRGYAADIKNIGNGTFTEFKDFVVKWVKDNNIPFDQLIIERKKSTGDMWLHIGIRNNAGQQRFLIQNMEV